MQKGCWRCTLLVALSQHIINIIVDPSVLGFEGMIQRFEATATGTNVCGAWDIYWEHCSLIVWSFLAYRAVIHDGGFRRCWNGVFILQNCLFAC